MLWPKALECLGCAALILMLCVSSAVADVVNKDACNAMDTLLGDVVETNKCIEQACLLSKAKDKKSEILLHECFLMYAFKVLFSEDNYPKVSQQSDNAIRNDPGMEK